MHSSHNDFEASRLGKLLVIQHNPNVKFVDTRLWKGIVNFVSIFDSSLAIQELNIFLFHCLVHSHSSVPIVTC